MYGQKFVLDYSIAVHSTSEYINERSSATTQLRLVLYQSSSLRGFTLQFGSLYNLGPSITWTTQKVGTHPSGTPSLMRILTPQRLPILQEFQYPRGFKSYMNSSFSSINFQLHKKYSSKFYKEGDHFGSGSCKYRGQSSKKRNRVNSLIHTHTIPLSYSCFLTSRHSSSQS